MLILVAFSKWALTPAAHPNGSSNSPTRKSLRRGVSLKDLNCSSEAKINRFFVNAMLHGDEPLERLRQDHTARRMLDNDPGTKWQWATACCWMLKRLSWTAQPTSVHAQLLAFEHSKVNSLRITRKNTRNLLGKKLHARRITHSVKHWVVCRETFHICNLATSFRDNSLAHPTPAI